LVDFARGLHALGVELISTGGTEASLRAAGLPVRSVEAVTGFPEVLGGRVKTLHPAIHAGILAVEGDPNHDQELAHHGIGRIGLVAVNLYPFLETVRQPAVALTSALEQIDIGGQTLLRAAAKNFSAALAVSDPRDYPMILRELGDGRVGFESRRVLAAK